MIKDLVKLVDDYLGVIVLNDGKLFTVFRKWSRNVQTLFKNMKGIISFSRWSITCDAAFKDCKNLEFIVGVSPNLPINISSMFFGASKFNSPLGHWDTSKVTCMKSMFYGASSFNQPLDKWDVSHCVLSMEYMFKDATSFNQSLDTWVIPESCSTRGMFSKTPTPNYDDRWDRTQISNVKKIKLLVSTLLMGGMFIMYHV